MNAMFDFSKYKDEHCTKMCIEHSMVLEMKLARYPVNLLSGRKLSMTSHKAYLKLLKSVTRIRIVYW